MKYIIYKYTYNYKDAIQILVKKLTYVIWKRKPEVEMNHLKDKWRIVIIR